MRTPNLHRRWNAGVAAAVIAGVMVMATAHPAMAARPQKRAQVDAQAQVQAGSQAQEDAPVQTAATDAGQAAVMKCLEQMRGAVHRTADGIGWVADRATGAIAKLDEKGAPEAALIRAAGKGLEAVGAIADRGHGQVNQIGGRCAKMLNKAGAPEAAFEVLRAGAQAAHEAIHERAQAAREAIGAALDAALAGDDGEDAPA